MYTHVDNVQVYNSTIADNTAYGTSTTQPPGVQVQGGTTVHFESTIIANNLYGNPPATDSDIYSSTTISGFNNLIFASNASIPPDTIVGKCPLLGSLRFNGGLTETQALLSRSPAIDKGNNTFGDPHDQRGGVSVNGDKNYPRVLGPIGGTARADIGAYELNQADEIFSANFEGC